MDERWITLVHENVTWPTIFSYGIKTSGWELFSQMVHSQNIIQGGQEIPESIDLKGDNSYGKIVP